MRTVLLACLSAFVTVLAGCSSTEIGLENELIFEDITASYISTTEIAGVGLLALELERVEDRRTVYQAQLYSADGDAEGQAEGIGTLGGTHLIINFDRGYESDYYFEGQVLSNAGVMTAISGQLVFPDNRGTYDINFTPVWTARL